MTAAGRGPLAAPSSLQTPAMQQYFRMKAENPDALLLFRMGDFYELFFDDAEIAAPLLEIALTSRSKDKDGRPIPMCGVPYHAASSYIARLVRQGHRVALCEQVEDPRAAKGVVKREVVRVITPGTQIDAGALDPEETSFVVAVSSGDDSVGLGALDATTGHFVALERSGPARWDHVRDELSALRPREIVFPQGTALPGWLEDATQPESALPHLAVEPLEIPRARRMLLEHFGVLSLDAFGCEESPRAIAAAAIALRYVRETQRRDLAHVAELRMRHRGDALVLDAVTRRNLELVESLADGSRRGTLLSVLDVTRTAMGSRALRDWLVAPLLTRAAIQDRLDAVEELAFRAVERGRLRTTLGEIQDLERLIGRVALRAAQPRDLAALARSLRSVPSVEAAIAEFRAPLVRQAAGALEPPLDVAADIENVLSDPAPASARDGGVIRDGVDGELDELRGISHGGRTTIAEIEVRERQRTGIQSLKVRFNRVFGYYIEVSKPNLPLVPSDYTRKQTIAGGERFITPELKEYEARVLQADERILAREAELFESLLSRISARAPAVRGTARQLAILDVLASLAEVAGCYDYVKPRLTDGTELAYLEGRHPVLERLTSEPFVANHLRLGEPDRRLLVLTGPNMGGKSTFLRQTGLITILAQMGSFVPAREARIGIVDRIFTRVGASDNILRGRSTFMVEMQETAHILRHASERSLVLLDEIGRGTATFDGLSIAWAVAESLASHAKAKTIFATHYHELVDLAREVPGVQNIHVSAREWKDTLVFLRKIEDGGSDRSFGIQVGRLAGLPAAVVARAKEVLRNLESSEFDRDGRPRLAHSEEPAPGARQLALFSGKEEAALEELRRLEIDELTPLQALALLAELKSRL